MAISKITTKAITDGTIATADLADNAVNSAKIGADVIVAEDVANNAITVNEIQNGAVTSAKLDTNIAVSGTLGVTGAVTANAGISVDNITIDGTEIDLSSGSLTVDSAGSITLDCGNGELLFNNAGNGNLLKVQGDSSNVNLISMVQDKDIRFQGNDGGSTITALSLDMSAGGNAQFNNTIFVADGDASAPGFRFKDDSNNGMFRAGTDIIGLSTAGTERLRISANGHVSIGTTTSTYRLNVADGRAMFTSQNNKYAVGLKYGDGVNGCFIGSPEANGFSVSSAGGGERLRVDGSGNVGILNTSPSSYGNATELVVGSHSIADAGITIATTTGSSARIQFADNTSDPFRGAIEYAHGSTDALMFYTAGSHRMRIDGDGRVMVGVTSLNLHQMAVHGTTGGNATFKVANTSTSGNTTTLLLFMDGSGSASVNSAFLQGFNGANNFYLLGNGTHTFTSDENAKKNIETTRDGYLEDLAKLRVVKYNWKEDEDGADKELGLIAQEVEKVFPKLVMNDIDPQIEEKDKKKMIKTTVLPFMLLKALQEANTKITTLEARITALESS